MTEAPGWLHIAHGKGPLIVSVPHAGPEIPEDCRDNLSEDVCLLRDDTDFLVDQLYKFAPNLGATMISTRLSRTVIDVNRDPSGKSLYPGQATTELCPTTTFHGEPLYADGRVPDAQETARRIETYYRPYHDTLAAEIERLKQMHGVVVLWDAHSIRSRVPRLFDGELPHLNFGTNSGTSCAPQLTAALEAIAKASDYSWVANGRFKGGYITRHYGQPKDGVHAVQLELAQRAYMDEDPDGRPSKGPAFLHDQRVASIRALLKHFLQACIDFAQTEKS